MLTINLHAISGRGSDKDNLDPPGRTAYGTMNCACSRVPTLPAWGQPLIVPCILDTRGSAPHPHPSGTHGGGCSKTCGHKLNFLLLPTLEITTLKSNVPERAMAVSTPSP